jgi:hypothetical protein
LTRGFALGTLNTPTTESNMNPDLRPPPTRDVPFNTRAEILEAFGCALLGCLLVGLAWVIL